MTTESRISLYRPMKQKDTCTGKKNKKKEEVAKALRGKLKERKHKKKEKKRKTNTAGWGIFIL